MHEICPNSLWIGHALDVRAPRSLFDVGIAAVVDVAFEEPTAQLPRQMTYCRFPLNDGGGNEPSLLLQTLRTVTGFLSLGIPTLVACSAGMSRSPTIVAFALAHHLDTSPDDVIQHISELKALEVNPQLWTDCIFAYQNLQR